MLAWFVGASRMTVHRPSPTALVPQRRRIAAWFWACLLAALCAGVAQSQSQPDAVRDLRANQRETAEALRQQAEALRSTSRDPVERAWAGLALAEFENDLERADAALSGYDTAQAEAEQLGLPDLRFAALTARSGLLVNRGRSEETAAVLAEMQAMVEQADEPAWRALWLHEKGVLERKLGRFDESLAYLEQALAVFRELGDDSMVARELNSIGIIHGRVGRFADAVRAHSEALERSRAAGDQGETARGLRMLGVLYRNIDDEELGSRYLTEALGYVEERNIREAITLHGELSKSLTLLDRHGEAEYHAERAVVLARTSGSPPNKVNSFVRMAELKLEQGKVDEAARWIEEGYASYDHVAIRDQTLLRVARARVLAAQDQPSASLREAEAALLATRRIGDRILERGVLDLLSEQQLKLGDAASAFATRKAHQALDKELAIDMASRRISALESSLERERSDAERIRLERDNALQALEINRQRLLGSALLLGLLGVLGLVGWLQRRNRRIERSRTALRESRDELARLHAALKESAAAMEQLAHTDALTGLGNRHALAADLDRRLADPARRHGLSLLLLDLDHFKQINDQYGHLAGDAVLRETAVRMRANLPSGGVAGRWGGEEFIVLLDDCPPAQARATAEALRQALAGWPVRHEGRTIRITTSIGVASNAERGTDAADPLLAAADAALYRAKREGRNRVEAA